MSSNCTEAQVDYPHLKLGGEGISAPDCNNVPKLRVGGAHGCSVEEMQTWLSEMRGWRTNRHIRMGYSGDMYDLPLRDGYSVTHPGKFILVERLLRRAER